MPYAGGTLFRLDDIEAGLATGSRLTDSSLLLLADILPTGYFAALQLLEHPKLRALLSGKPYPHSTLASGGSTGGQMTTSREILNIALIGLGPVGIVSTTISSKISGRSSDRAPVPFLSQCATVSLLDLLWKNEILHYRVIAVDPHEQRRNLIKAIYNKLLQTVPTINPKSTFDAIDIETSKRNFFSVDGVGFDGVIEVNLYLVPH